MEIFGNNIDGYYDVSNQFVDNIRTRAEVEFHRRAEEKKNLRSVADFEKYRNKVRNHFLGAIGGLPQEKTPLKPKITGVLDRGSYTIEKVLYESLPEFYVTAVLYVPKSINGKAPAVVFVNGHTELTKAYPLYQKVAIDLVTNGFIVFAIDPIAQGERYQYLKDGKKAVGSCTREHTYIGLQYFLQGRSIAQQFIWDVIRGIDYLETRPEVDTARIGITGNSGGGTQTSFLMLADPRIAAAIPCTFITTLKDILFTGLPQDAEQIVPGCFVQGPDHDDFLTAIAPKPVLVGAVAYDFFPLEGSIEAVKRAKQIYQLYGKPDHVDIAIAPSRHEYAAELREAAVNWFKKHLKGEKPDFKTKDPEILEDIKLQVTKTGQVVTDFPKSQKVFDLNVAGIPKSPEIKTKTDALQRIEEVLKISHAGIRSDPIYAKIGSEKIVDDYPIEKIFFFSSPGIKVSGVLIHPKERLEKQPTTLLLLEKGTLEMQEKRAMLEGLLDQKQKVFVFDVRGTGGVQPGGVNVALETDVFNKQYRLACDAMMLGITTLGLRVFDALRGYDYLKSRNDISEIRIHGIGKAALTAFFAGFIEDGFKSLHLEDMLQSYRSVCETRYYDRTQNSIEYLPYGVLKHFDLPDLIPLFGSRQVELIRLRDAQGNLISSETQKKPVRATAVAT